MNEKNFEYLRDQVKYSGFGEGLENELREKLQQQTPTFTLHHSAHYGNDIAVATLNFRKSDQSDMYFFNSYRVNLQKDHSKEFMEQTFYINNKGNSINMKEAYNLMEGRAVNKDLTNKEGQVYNGWVQMDFKEADSNGNFKLNHYHQNYGYDLKDALAKSPVKELNDPKIINDEGFLNSLKKGNLQSVIIMKNDSSEKIYVDANPQFKAVNVYDSNRQRIDTRLSKDEKQSESEGKGMRQDSNRQSRAAADDDGPDIPKEGKKKRKNQSNSM